MTIKTEYPLIINGKVIENKSRCGDKCSTKAPFMYQKGEYANIVGSTNNNTNKVLGFYPIVDQPSAVVNQTIDIPEAGIDKTTKYVLIGGVILFIGIFTFKNMGK